MSNVLNAPIFFYSDQIFVNNKNAINKISLFTILLQNLCNFLLHEDLNYLDANESILIRLAEYVYSDKQLDAIKMHFYSKYLMLILYESFIAVDCRRRDFFMSFIPHMKSVKYFKLKDFNNYPFYPLTYRISTSLVILLSHVQLDIIYTIIGDITKLITYDHLSISPDDSLYFITHYFDTYYGKIFRWLPSNEENILTNIDRYNYLFTNLMDRQLHKINKLLELPFYNERRSYGYRCKKFMTTYICYIDYIHFFIKVNGFDNIEEDIKYFYFSVIYDYSLSLGYLCELNGYIVAMSLKMLLIRFDFKPHYFQRACERYIMLLLTFQMKYKNFNFTQLLNGEERKSIACAYLLDYKERQIEPVDAFHMIISACKAIPFRKQHEVAVYIEFLASLLHNEEIKLHIKRSREAILALTDAVTHIFTSYLNTIENHEANTYKTYYSNIRNIVNFLELILQEPFFEHKYTDSTIDIVTEIGDVIIEEYNYNSEYNCILLYCLDTLAKHGYSKIKPRNDLERLYASRIAYKKNMLLKHHVKHHSIVYERLTNLNNAIKYSNKYIYIKLAIGISYRTLLYFAIIGI
jgi:hypothetical protein